MDKPLISVVIPTYNHAQYLKDAVHSVLEQTYDPLELIVVDNFSNDNTEEIINDINDQRLQYHKFANQGIIAASRNYGAKKAKGEYIAFLDSDDVWKKDKIEKQHQIIKNNYALCFSRLVSISENQEDEGKVFGFKGQKCEGMIFNKLLMKNFIPSSSVLIKKNVFDQYGGFDESNELVCSEDFDLWLRIAKKEPITFVPEILGNYRIHGSNMNNPDQRLKKAFAVIEKHFDLNNINSREMNTAKTSFCIQIGYDMINVNTQEARSYFQKAREFHFNFKNRLLYILGFCLMRFPQVVKFLKRRKNQLHTT